MTWIQRIAKFCCLKNRYKRLKVGLILILIQVGDNSNIFYRCLAIRIV